MNETLFLQFDWWPDPSHRVPLRAGKDRWTACVSELRILALSPSILLECVLSAPPRGTHRRRLVSERTRQLLARLSQAANLRKRYEV